MNSRILNEMRERIFMRVYYRGALLDTAYHYTDLELNKHRLGGGAVASIAPYGSATAAP